MSTVLTLGPPVEYWHSSRLKGYWGGGGRGRHEHGGIKPLRAYLTLITLSGYQRHTVSPQGLKSH